MTPFKASLVPVLLIVFCLVSAVSSASERVVRFSADRAQVDVLPSWLDVWHVGADGTVFAAVDDEALSRLRLLGYEPTIDEEQTAQLARVGVALPEQGSGIPGFPCYRTVEETYAAAASLAERRPEIAAWLDVGDSWEKTQNAEAGYDLFVLRVGRTISLQPPSDAPNLLISTAMHPREYTTAELATRFGERLVDGYGVDPDITWLLDHQLVHLMLQVNPDGRKRAETGLSWRKNTNNDYCSDTNDRGSDLNRNFSFEWGCCGGSSSSECSLTYRGASAASEPETQALQDYATGVFADRRPPDLTTPAPDDTMGVLLDIHSFGEDVLWSWGFTSTQPPAPNGAQLYTLGRKYGFYTDYRPQHGSFSTVDGSTKDFAYGEFGVPGFTIELGTTFFQTCEFFENDILEQNIDALLYTAKASRAPYRLPAGPEPFDTTANPAAAVRGENVWIRSTVDDARFTALNGTEPSQTIVSARVYVDTPPWIADASPVPMSASDGAFDATSEDVELLLDTSTLSLGRHLLFVEATDADGNVGVVDAVFLDLSDPIFGDDFESGDLSAWTSSAP